MRQISILHPLISTIFSAVAWLVYDWGHAASFFLGSFIFLINFLLLEKSWRLIIYNKSNGLSFFIIVFKYALLAFLIYTITKTQWIQIIPLSFGIVVFTITALLYALIQKKSKIT